MSKIFTANLQFLHNTVEQIHFIEKTKNWKKWSGHGKMIDSPWRASTYKRPFIREGNYLVYMLFHDWNKIQHIWFYFKDFVLVLAWFCDEKRGSPGFRIELRS